MPNKMSITLQNEIEQKLASIDFCLQSLNSQQLDLNENNIKIKNSISGAIEAQIAYLKLRERQLVRQCEIVAGYQKNILDDKVNKIHQMKGALQLSKEMLNHQAGFSDCENIKRICNKFDISCSNELVQPLSMMSVEFDSNPVASSIKDFGKVSIPDSLKQHNSVSVNEWVLSFPGPEEHKNSGEEISYKEVNEDSNVFQVEFPKLPKEGWLSIESDSKIAESVKLPEKAKSKLSDDLSSWLSAKKERSPLSTEKDSQSSYPPPNDYDALEDWSRWSSKESSKSRCSSIGSSIEVISPSLPKKETFGFGSCRSLVSIEDFACQANSPCQSYSECIMGGYCEDIAAERSLQTSKWLSKNADQQRSVSPKSGGEKDNRTSNLKNENVELMKNFSPVSGFSLVSRETVNSGGKSIEEESKPICKVLEHMQGILTSDLSKWLLKNSSLKEKEEQQTQPLFFSPVEWISGRRHEFEEPSSKSMKKEKRFESILYTPRSDQWTFRKQRTEYTKEIGVTSPSPFGSSSLESMGSLKNTLTELATLATRAESAVPQDDTDRNVNAKWLSGSSLSNSTKFKDSPSLSVRKWSNPNLHRWILSMGN